MFKIRNLTVLTSIWRHSRPQTSVLLRHKSQCQARIIYMQQINESIASSNSCHFYLCQDYW